MATATAQEREALTRHIEGIFRNQYASVTLAILEHDIADGKATSFAVYYDEGSVGRIGRYETNLYRVRACSVREYAELVVDRIMEDAKSFPLPDEIYCVDILS